MKRTAISIVAALLTSLSAQAQVNPMVLSENHAMVRLETGCKYVLLPVEEKAEMPTYASLVWRTSVRVVRMYDWQLTTWTITCP